MKKFTRDDTEHGKEYYLASDVEALMAQPEQEPFEYWNAVEGWVKVDEVRQHFDSVGCGTIYKTAGEGREPVYTTPPKRKPLTDDRRKEIELAARNEDWTINDIINEVEAAHNIKEHQSCDKREWIGLTNKEIYMNCPNWLSQEQCKVWVQQIEAKLKEKNK